MDINPNIILQNAPLGAAASVSPGVFSGNINSAVASFKPVSVLEEEQASLKRQEEAAQFAEMQRVRDQQANDRNALSQYVRDGGDLFTADGLQKALGDLKGSASIDALSGISKQLNVARKSEQDTQESISKMDQSALDLDSARTEHATRLLSAPLEVYAAAQKDGADPINSIAAFQDSKIRILEDAAKATVPGTDRPLYGPQFLERLSNSSPEELQALLRNTKWYGDRLKNEASIRGTEALISRREQQTSNDEERLSIARKRLELAQEKASKSNDVNEQDVQAAAELISTYRMQPLSGFALRTPYGQQVTARVAQLNPEWDAKEYFSRAKSEKDFATGKQGNTVRSFNVAIAHLDTLDKLSDALANGDVKLINSIGNRVAKETGSAAPTNFEAAKKIVADEIVKAIVGTGGGVTDRQEAAASISATNSPEQLKGAIQTYKELMKGQLDGLRDQYKAATSKDDFDTRFLSAGAREVATGAETKKTDKTSEAKSADKTYRQIGKYKTPNEVRDDYRAGKLTRQEAKNVLTRMGYENG